MKRVLGALVILAGLLLFGPQQVEAQPPGQPEVTRAISCLSGNGRVDTTIVNTGTRTATYRLEFEGLSARQRIVEPGDWARLPITGRRDGSYRVTIKRDGTLISNQINTVACDTNPPRVSTPEVQTVSSCRNNRGYIWFQLVNPTSVAKPYVIKFQGIPNRSTTAQPWGAGVKAVTGRPDGTYTWTIVSGSTTVETGTITVNCNNNPTPDTQPPTWPNPQSIEFGEQSNGEMPISIKGAADNVGVTGYALYFLGGRFETSSEVVLRDLEPNVNYDLRIEALDAAGNESTTGPSYQFTGLASDSCADSTNARLRQCVPIPVPRPGAVEGSNWVHPIDQAQINMSSARGWRWINNNADNHAGMDFGVATGTPVRAVTAGTIVHNDACFGMVVIDHDDGTQTYSLHMDPRTDKPVGARVEAGEWIGNVNGRGCESNNEFAPHLHFEVIGSGDRVTGTVLSGTDRDRLAHNPLGYVCHAQGNTDYVHSRFGTLANACGVTSYGGGYGYTQDCRAAGTLFDLLNSTVSVEEFKRCRGVAG